MEEVYKDRDQFATLVREVAAPDVGRMGIEILSFTIKDVYDDVQYLASLGKAQTAAVKRDADVGVAEANRDAGIRVRSYAKLYIGACDPDTIARIIVVDYTGSDRLRVHTSVVLRP